MKEVRTGSIIKAISWRCCATITTISIVYIFTRKWMLSLGIGLVEAIAKITFYYFHERLWGKILG